ncbi:MAG: penicillin-binding transpeptidase domain-containing protein, partial [Eubacteriales bacterium]|nr:penicillin-binding transpeptidase domain-containing protein [Eubacteriales bacterium]
MLRSAFDQFIEDFRAWLDKPRQIRLIILTFCFLALFVVLGVRLYNLQIVQGEEFSSDFISKIERTVYTAGSRGNIYDANGNLLAYNKLSYNVTIADNGAYANDYNARNVMLYRLASILEKHGVKITTAFYVDMNEDGEYYYTTRSEAARKRFVANVYGIKTADLDTKEKYTSNVTAKELLDLKIDSYKFNAIKDTDGSPIIPSDKMLLDMVKILFTMRQTAFQKYETTTIAKDIDEYCVADLLENAGDLKGISVEETYIRKYNNAKYFAHIIGYTGAIKDYEQLDELKIYNSEYEITDIVGATGIEKSMETELQGKKGMKRMHVDSTGQILDIIEESDPNAGNDIYLTIDQNLQIGTYHLLEQSLAAVLANKIVNLPASEIIIPKSSSDVVISIDDAYYQLINNNILSTPHFGDLLAGVNEKSIYRSFKKHKSTVLSRVSYELLTDNDSKMSELTNEYISYMAYIYDFLTTSDIVDKSKIDTYGETYLKWKDNDISLRDYLLKGIAEGWINISALDTSGAGKYSDSKFIYSKISDVIIAQINDDEAFDKLIYKYMIINDEISGKELMLALFEQGILAYDADAINALSEGDEEYAYSFFIERILDIDITPAQLALDPCMGSVVITDVKTGQVKALVTYPGYDNNKITDTDYFNKCINDLSLPLINSATQTNKAPGSTFKPISAVAVLEEHKATTEEKIVDTGVYEEVSPPISCWIGRPGHGPLTVKEAIEHSCNYAFAEYGHRLSTYIDTDTIEPVYSTTVGNELLAKYAAMFGLDRKSGIEIEEKAPSIADEDPERS